MRERFAGLMVALHRGSFELEPRIGSAWVGLAGGVLAPGIRRL